MHDVQVIKIATMLVISLPMIPRVSPVMNDDFGTLPRFGTSRQHVTGVLLRVPCVGGGISSFRHDLAARIDHITHGSLDNRYGLGRFDEGPTVAFHARSGGESRGQFRRAKRRRSCDEPLFLQNGAWTRNANTITHREMTCIMHVAQSHDCARFNRNLARSIACVMTRPTAHDSIVSYIRNDDAISLSIDGGSRHDEFPSTRRISNPCKLRLVPLQIHSLQSTITKRRRPQKHCGHNAEKHRYRCCSSAKVRKNIPRIHQVSN